MNKFIILWSLISPACLSLIAGILQFYRLGWNPGYPDIRRSIQIYLVYWLLLGILQGGVLLWKFRERQFAYRWFFTTSTTGFLVMLLHDLSLALLGIDTGGQGVLNLIYSLPWLAVLGGPILGLAQFLLIRNRYKINLRLNNLGGKWFVISFLSWTIGFVGIIFCLYVPPVLILFVASGSAIKGWFIQKYLRENQ